MSILSQLFPDLDTTPAPGKKSLQGDAVFEGPELLRIERLPRRRWEDAQDLPKLVELLSGHLATPEGRRLGVRLFPMQAAALRELHDQKKLCVYANVGVGKTLLGALAPTVAEAKRPLWLVYAKLIEKSKLEVSRYARHWNVCLNFRFMSVESLSRETGYQALVDYNPDMIIFDEAHAMKSPKSGRTRKLLRFKAEHPGTVFVPMTGTPGDDSLANIAHVQEIVHGEGSPVPRTTSELNPWCEALDARPAVRRDPGVLARFAGGSNRLDAVREGVGARIAETPGNVFYRTNDVACSLYLEGVLHTAHNKTTLDNFAHIRANPDETITGQVLEEGTQVHLSLTTCGLGFVHVIDPPPPAEWRAARKSHGAYVREVLAADIPDLDTPAMVVNAILRGELQDGGRYERWRAIRDTFKPVSRAEWFDESALEAVAKWAKSNIGLVWVPYPDFARKLSELSGLPFYHNNGICKKTGKSITEHPETSSAILSTQACSTGHNLQRFCRNLIVAPSGKSDLNNQLLGRTHRFGQTADAVEAYFFLTSIENVEALDKARARARFDRDFGGDQKNKLLVGDDMLPTISEVRRLDGPAWTK